MGFAKKRAEREARQAKVVARNVMPVLAEPRAASDWETKSECTEATASTAVSEVDEGEVRCRAMAEKEVRRLEKLLRDITKLEGRDDLDKLQEAKVARRPYVEVELTSALAIAAARARNELRC